MCFLWNIIILKLKSCWKLDCNVKFIKALRVLKSAMAYRPPPHSCLLWQTQYISSLLVWEHSSLTNTFHTKWHSNNERWHQGNNYNYSSVEHLSSFFRPSHAQTNMASYLLHWISWHFLTWQMLIEDIFCFCLLPHARARRRFAFH